MVDASGHAQITDFGLSQNQNTLEETHVTAGGTPRWTAPEILEEKALSSKGADVFSFAMVMIEVGWWIVRPGNLQLMTFTRQPRSSPVQHLLIRTRLWQQHWSSCRENALHDQLIPLLRMSCGF